MPRYYWWDGADIADFFAEVNRLGSENVRVRFDPKAGLLHVDPKGGDVTAEGHENGDNGDDGGYNFVHTCPPDCD